MVRLVLTLVACGRGVSAPPAAAPLGGVLTDACEPSALVRLGDTWVVGDNETEDHLFVYDAAMAPLANRPLGVRVEDVEALVVAGADVMAVGSHSRNKEGKEKPDRRRVLPLGASPFSVDFAACAACVAAEPLAPNAGGVNVEGAALAGEDLVLGLRSPLDRGSALLLVVSRAAPAGQVKRVLTLPLGGQGVRDLVPFRGGYLVVGGPPVDAPDAHSVWFLSSLDAAPERLPVSLPPGTEGVWPVDDRHIRYVIDGDGEPGACRTAGAWGEVELPPAAPQPSRK